MWAITFKKLRLTKNYIIHPSVAAEKEIGIISSADSDVFRIVSVGRFVPLKGFDLAIRSFAIFYRSLSPDLQNTVKLTLLGSGPAKALLHKIVREECIASAIEFIEWMPKDEVKNIYQTASVFLFPSHEGAGMVVPEAMSYGLPVVCLKNCGPGDMLHPDSCLAVPYGNYKLTATLLARKLSQLYGDEGFMLKEKQLSAMTYNNLFRWDVRGEMLKNTYQTALEQY